MGFEGFGPLPRLRGQGVYKTSVDLRQHKVTVMGNVDAATLIRKLQKAGKHAELWPEKPKKEKDKGNNKDNATKDDGAGKESKSDGKPKEKDSGSGEGGKPSAKNSDSSDSDKVSSPKAGGKESAKAEGKDAGSSSPPPDKQGATGGAAEGDKSGGGGGKKGKKAQGGGGNGGEASQFSGGGPLQLHQGHPHFPVYSAHPLPVYAVCYCAAHPSASYGGAYYTALPPQHHVYTAQQQQQQQQSYAMYYLQPAGVFIPPSEEEGSYDVFSDENANACRVM